ncbi:MAG TPA: cupin domain-containing protein [Planctomycetota bacterium]|nr:cupin domain-containing protein [Planctomycetota bacterium]
METPVIVRAGECEVVSADWGRLTWYAGRKLGNSAGMTLGICVIRPGRANPTHSHPNCEEVLRVARGRIVHTAEGGTELEMGEGDVITVPVGFPHHARNIGEDDAVLEVAFSSADRQVRGE